MTGPARTTWARPTRRSTDPRWRRVTSWEDAQARASDEVLRFDGPFQTVDGEPRWVVRRKRGVTLPGGGRGVLTAVHDVTELRTATLEAERSRRFLDASSTPSRCRCSSRTGSTAG